MKSIFRLFSAAILLGGPALRAEVAATPAVAASPSAEATLKALVDRGRALLAEAATEKTGTAVAPSLQPKFQKLVDDYESYLHEHPELAAGYVAYAMLLSQLEIEGGRKRAVGLLLKANELDPKIPLVQNQLGNYLAEEGLPLGAVKYYQAAIQLDPQEPKYRLQLGNLLSTARDTLLKSPDWPRATLDRTMLDAFATAEKLVPDNLVVAYRHAQALGEIEHPDWNAAWLAWRALEPRAKTEIEKEGIWLQEANVKWQQKDLAGAKALLAAVEEPIYEKSKAQLTKQIATAIAAPTNTQLGAPQPSSDLGRARLPAVPATLGAP